MFLPHQADHIIPEQHGGSTSAENLALACIHCNRYKGPNLASLDPLTGELTPLFNPRIQVWTEHFILEQAYIQPLSPIGRVTAQLLRLNHPDRIRVRQALTEVGTYP